MFWLKERKRRKKKERRDGSKDRKEKEKKKGNTLCTYSYTRVPEKWCGFWSDSKCPTSSMSSCLILADTPKHNAWVQDAVLCLLYFSKTSRINHLNNPLKSNHWRAFIASYDVFLENLSVIRPIYEVPQYILNLPGSPFSNIQHKTHPPSEPVSCLNSIRKRREAEDGHFARNLYSLFNTSILTYIGYVPIL